MGEPQAAIPHLDAANELAARLTNRRTPRYIWLGELARAQSRLGDFKGLLATRRLAYESARSGIHQTRRLTNYARSTLAARKVPDSLDLLRRAIELEKQFDTGKGSWLTGAVGLRSRARD